MENFNIKLEIVSFHKCSRITIENLMTVDARRIDVLTGKVFNNEEVNILLKHWLTGRNLRLKHIQLDLKDWNEEAALEGINVQKGTPRERNYTG
uniref:FBA_2 domain-containing protein n=1 Tax=Caenorhabditis tropicalis TaxID=1561998 RepID=A0A1I7UQN1_9PELO